MMDRLLTAGDVAKLLTMTPFWVKDHTSHSGRPANRQPALRGIMVGTNRHLRYREADVEQFVTALAGETPDHGEQNA